MNERLYRARDDRFILGVAAGVADQLNVDPSLVRILWAILIIPTGGLALLLYIIMAFVVPEEPADLDASASAATGQYRRPPAKARPWQATPGARHHLPTGSSKTVSRVGPGMRRRRTHRRRSPRRRWAP